MLEDFRLSEKLEKKTSIYVNEPRSFSLRLIARILICPKIKDSTEALGHDCTQRLTAQKRRRTFHENNSVLELTFFDYLKKIGCPLVSVVAGSNCKKRQV